jgi:hypothetical protein
MADLADWYARAASFKDEATNLLGIPSGAVTARANLLDKRCVTAGLNRPAQIMAWLALINLVFEKLSEDGLVALKRERPAWHGTDIYEISETITEFAIVDTLQLVGLATKTEKKNILGLLSRRNECAHPTSYQPTSNESLGYIDEVINRMSKLQQLNVK